MLSLSDLELRETGFQRSHVFPRHRCDLVALGVSRETDPLSYDWRNANRSEGCLFQITLEGRGHYQTLPDGKRMPVPPGSAILVELPSQTRYWLEPGDQWGFMYVILEGETVRDLVRLLMQRHGAIWDLSSAHYAMGLLGTLHRRVCAGQIPDAFELSTFAYTLLMELFRSGSHPGRSLSSPVSRALSFMEEHYANPDLSMAEIETAAACSRYHLSRLFRRDTGSSPYATLQDIRIRKALWLLNHREDSVKEIAWQCGYRDTANFCREFKRRTQNTPSQARKLKKTYKFTSVHTP